MEAIKPKFKVGDIVAGCIKKDILFKIEAAGVINTWGFSVYHVNILDSDDDKYPVGFSDNWGMNWIDENTELAFLDDHKSFIKSSICRCPIFELMNIGCKCGGK